MDELLIFKDNQTGDNVGMYYNTWLLIIKCILIEYAYKTTEEAIMKSCTWAMKPSIIGLCSELTANCIG